MALIECPECGKEISEKSKTCINCGYPISEYVRELQREQDQTETEQAKENQETYQPESGNHQERTFSSEISKTNYVAEKAPFWKRWWFLTLMCIFIPPVGICLLWIAKKPKYAPVRTTLSVFLAMYAVIWCVAMFGEADNTEEQPVSDQAIQENSVDENVKSDISHEDLNISEESESDSIYEESVSNEAEAPSVEETDVEEEVSETDDEYKASCTEYNYKDVLRNPDKYVGKRVKITAKVSSVHDKGLLNPVKYYFAYANDEYDMWLGDQYGVFDYRETEDPKILDDDVIAVYGEISEPQETKSLIVNSQEIFCIDMKYAELISE